MPNNREILGFHKPPTRSQFRFRTSLNFKLYLRCRKNLLYCNLIRESEHLCFGPRSTPAS